MVKRITGTDPIGLDTLENIAFKINEFCSKNSVNPYIISHTYVLTDTQGQQLYTALLTWERISEQQDLGFNLGPGRRM